MTLFERLRQMADALPPGSSVTLPRDWLLAELDATQAVTTDALAIDLTADTLAALFGKRPSTVRAWLEAGRLPGAYKLGKQWRVPRAAVDAFQAREREAGRPDAHSSPDHGTGSLADWRTVRHGDAA